LVDTTLSNLGNTVILDTRRLTLTSIPGPEFDWEGKIKLVGKETLYAFLSRVCYFRNNGNLLLILDNYGKGTWWPLKYVRISLQPGGYLLYDRYKNEIDFKTFLGNTSEEG